MQKLDYSSNPMPDEVDLNALFAELWGKKNWLIVFVLIVSVSAAGISLMMPNIYRSEALLAPVSADQLGGAGLSGQFGGLASLAGISLKSGGGDKTALGIEVLKSRQFFKKFIENRDVLVPLMATKEWQQATRTLVISDSIYDVVNQQWVRDAEPPFTQVPSVQEAHEKFLKLFSVTQDKASGFVTIAIDHPSPDVAQQWVEWLVEDINATIRDQDVLQAERSINYLNEQIASTSVIELQSGLFEMVQSQIETIMLAKASPEYLFKTIDPAVVPQLKDRPKRAIIVMLSGLLAGILGIVFLTFKYLWRRDA